MSEPGPESIPTSADPRTRRPTKRRALTPYGTQASELETLMRDPNKELKLPAPSKPKTSASLPPPPEIVANVQGSSAGAGSGEFHVYKASRRREYERLGLMQREVDQDKADEEWQRKREEARREDEERTEKNRRKREKRRVAKGRGQSGQNNGGNGGGATGMEVDGGGGKKKEGDLGKHKALADGEEGTGQPQEEGPGVIIHED